VNSEHTSIVGYVDPDEVLSTTQATIMVDFATA
jgi:hypothetical protein